MVSGLETLEVWVPGNFLAANGTDNIGSMPFRLRSLD